MTCPVVSVLPNRERVQCDPEYIQVIRQVPHDNWNNELQWSLSLSDHLVVALEDASLIQIDIDMNGPDITVQGRRKEILSPMKVMETDGEFLALKLVSGQYAYSMEAVCPKVTTSTAEEAVLHIFKQRMGLTKRGRSDNEGLTVGHVSVNQTDNFTVHETSEFVTLIIPTTQILQTKTCAHSKLLLQSFYRVDVVLTFKETNHKMHWTMENTLPCTARPAASNITSSPGPNITALSMLTFKNESLTTEQVLLDHFAVPVGKPNKSTPFEETTAEFSTISSPHTQTEGSSFNSHIEEMSEIQSGNLSPGFEGGTITSIDAAVTDLHTTVSHEQEYKQFNSTRGNKDQQKQRKLKWIW
ncbi:uncharacterized protein C1orf127 homolog isoform X2 [Trachinotus anak]